MSNRRQKMTKLINTLDVKGLEKLWTRVAVEEGNGGIFTLRELIMNRLEEINPAAFDCWLDQENDSDFSVFY